MHFVILGAGALGSILAAHLHDAGHRVQLMARGQRAEFLRTRGVTLTGLTRRNAHCEIITDPALVIGADTLIVTVKTYDMVEALTPLRDADFTTVLSVQNGVLKNVQLGDVFGARKVLGAMSDFSGELLSSGEVEFTRNICLHLGEPETAASSARAQHLAATIDAAGINARAVSDITSVEWSKYVVWVAMMVISVLTRLQTWRYFADPDSARMMVTIVREMAHIAAAKEIKLQNLSPLPARVLLDGSLEAATATVQDVGETLQAQAPEHRMSSLQDLLRQRPLELEETVGYALHLADTLQMDMPCTRSCYHLVRAVNANFCRA